MKDEGILEILEMVDVADGEDIVDGGVVDDSEIAICEI
jgi:hypothetical protein